MKKLRYEYAVLPVTVVICCSLDLINGPGAYLSEDKESRAYRTLLEEGWRWVRTENGFAVFEIARESK